MKVTNNDRSTWSAAIDRMSAGLDEMIEIYNNADEDVPFFSDDVQAKITKASEVYGEDDVKNKINTIVGEMLDWLPLDQNK